MSEEDYTMANCPKNLAFVHRIDAINMKAWIEGFEAEHRFLIAMDERVEEKQEEYGNSWKTVGKGHLRFRVKQNFDEWFTTSRNDTETEKRKLVDLANLCRFLWERLNEKEVLGE